MKVIVTLPLFAFSIIVGFAQTPEWVEYCQLKKTTQSELVTSDTIYKTYCVMDSIYNGIPLFTDLFQFLKAAIACDEQEKIKELAFRIVRWKCWDCRLFEQPDLVWIKQKDYWPQLDTLSLLNCKKSNFTDYMRELYMLKLSDQQCRKSLHDALSKEEVDSVWTIIHFTDSQNLEKLKDLINHYGFPTWEKVGYDYALCAWIIAQHADSAFLHEYVEQLKKAVANDNANPKNLAYMIDRDLMNQNLPQLYGTQSIAMLNSDGVMEDMLWPVENIDQLNARREHMLLAPMDTVGVKIYDLQIFRQ